MERELRTALRTIRSSGQSLELIERLLEDASWDTVIETEKMVHRVRKVYHAKRVLRAFTVHSSTLHGFKIHVKQFGNAPEVPMKLLSVERSETAILFKAEYRPSEHMTTEAMALYDDENFCFGLRPYHGGRIAAVPGDILNMTYRLEHINGIV